jgi:beta-catenin-like protein 1
LNCTDEFYKSAKLSPNGDSTRHARVDDDSEANGPTTAEEDDDPDASYGPSAPPPDGDDADDQGDDEEGRFFGGGVTASESQALSILESAATITDAAPEKIDVSWLRKTILQLERRINKNAELRAKYEAEPAKFIDSEADLDASIRSLSLLAENTELYAEFVRLGATGSLVGLLAHENSDVAIAVAGIVGELVDEDVAATEEQWGLLVDAMLEADLVGLLVATLGRLDEDADEADREGVYNVLGVVESLCSRIETALTLGKNDKLVKWLLQRIQRSEKGITQNKQYAAELLAILAQAGDANRTQLAEQYDAVDTILQLIAPYRRKDPEKGGEEEEFMADLFEVLTSIVDVTAGKDAFVAAEGVELCLILLKDGKASKLPALRLLDHASGGSASTAASGIQVCIKIVEAGGLKTLFSMFMKKAHEGAMTEHLVGIFASMMRLLPSDSPERIRTLAKFMEKDYEKTGKLISLRKGLVERLDAAADDVEDAAQFVLETVDVLLAWLVAEDDGAKKKIVALLANEEASDKPLARIAATLQGQLEGIDTDTEDGRDTAEMLSTLIEFLQ